MYFCKTQQCSLSNCNLCIYKIEKLEKCTRNIIFKSHSFLVVLQSPTTWPIWQATTLDIIFWMQSFNKNCWCLNRSHIFYISTCRLTSRTSSWRPPRFSLMWPHWMSWVRTVDSQKLILRSPFSGIATTLRLQIIVLVIFRLLLCVVKPVLTTTRLKRSRNSDNKNVFL